MKLGRQTEDIKLRWLPVVGCETQCDSDYSQDGQARGEAMEMKERIDEGQKDQKQEDAPWNME